MKNNTTQSAASSFAITFTSANPNEYPVIYAEDQWHTANKSDIICQLYDQTYAESNTTATGAQFTQREINDVLAGSVLNNQEELSGIQTQIESLNKSVKNINSGLVNVYRFKGSVSDLDGLHKLSEKSSAGDVYNVQATGMNYAFVGITQSVHLLSGAVEGFRLMEFAQKCLGNPQHENMIVNGESKTCTIGATSDNKGHILLYAFIGDLSTGSPDQATGQFVDLESYDGSVGMETYTKTTTSVKYYKINSESEMWDALGESQSLTLWEE